MAARKKSHNKKQTDMFDENRQEKVPVGFLWIFQRGCSKIERHPEVF